MSNDTEVMTLTEFLLARKREQYAAQRDDLWGRGLPRDVAENLLGWKMHELRSLIRLTVGSLLLTARPDLARTLALSYAEHPDYREEWRP